MKHENWNSVGETRKKNEHKTFISNTERRTETCGQGDDLLETTTKKTRGLTEKENVPINTLFIRMHVYIWDNRQSQTWQQNCHGQNTDQTVINLY